MISFIKYKQKDNGFILIDVLLYIVISSLLLLTVVSFTAVILEAKVKNNVVMEVEQQGAYVLREVWKAGRSAEEVLSPQTGQSSDTLTIMIDGEIISFSFDVSNKSLVKVKEGGAVPITGGGVEISEVTFTNLGTTTTPASIKTEFVVNYRSDSVRAVYNYSKRFNGGVTLR